MVLTSLMVLRETPNGGTLWFRYMRALIATTRVPPSGFLTGMACVQSNGKFDMDHMMGCTFCWMLRDMATIAHVSWRTAMRLKHEFHVYNLTFLLKHTASGPKTLTQTFDI